MTTLFPRYLKPPALKPGLLGDVAIVNTMAPRSEFGHSHIVESIRDEDQRLVSICGTWSGTNAAIGFQELDYITCKQCLQWGSSRGRRFAALHPEVPVTVLHDLVIDGEIAAPPSMPLYLLMHHVIGIPETADTASGTHA